MLAVEVEGEAAAVVEQEEVAAGFAACGFFDGIHAAVLFRT